MTSRAARSSPEQHEAPSGTLGQRVGLAGHEPFVGRTARDDGAHVGGQRAGHVEDGRFAAERGGNSCRYRLSGKGQDASGVAPSSSGFRIGPSACCSSVAARPSQKKLDPQARFTSVGSRQRPLIRSHPGRCARRS